MSGDSNKILVVDDEAVIRELMTDILTEEGYEVESAPGGIEALELLREDNRFVLLFTDIHMPEMDGIELIREARDLHPYLIPIVMTGYATLETARAAVKEGAYDYVLKPFSLSEIKLAVSNALERHRLINENARLRTVAEMFDISEAIVSIHDKTALLDFVLEAALDRVGAERGSILIASEDGTTLEVATSVELCDSSGANTSPARDRISEWVAENARALNAEDLADIPELSDLREMVRDAPFISVPLVRKLFSDTGHHEHPTRTPRVQAVLNVDRPKDGAHFNEGDLKVLRIVANHTAVALQNVRLLRDVEDAHLATLKSMALVLEAKDPYTHGHSERVRNYAMIAAMKLGMSDADVETIRLGAMLHDVGKIGVSDAILNKVEKLTAAEWKRIKLHPVIGFEVLEPVDFLTPEHLRLVRSHHERLDGTGYPDGLSADELDDRVRVLAVADMYDAMSSSRAYRAGLSRKKILDELQRASGTQLDPTVVKLFIDMILSGEIEQYADRDPLLDG